MQKELDGEHGEWMNRFLQFQGADELSRKAVVQLIQYIQVKGKNSLRIKFNFDDEYREALETLAAAEHRKAG